MISTAIRSRGHYYIPHRANVLPKFQSECASINDVFGYGVQMMSREELHREHVCDQEAAGAMWEPDGTCIHAATLAFDYVRLVRKLGTKIYTASPVMGWKFKSDVHHLITPGGARAG